jgi:hypothetical protein
MDSTSSRQLGEAPVRRTTPGKSALARESICRYSSGLGPLKTPSHGLDMADCLVNAVLSPHKRSCERLKFHRSELLFLPSAFGDSSPQLAASGTKMTPYHPAAGNISVISTTDE